MDEAPSPFTSLARGEGRVTATVDPTHAAAATAGHFPNEPLLPGSALLELMALAARALATEAVRLVAVERAVFRRRVGPAERIVVSASRVAGHVVDSLVRADEADAATARLRFEPLR